MHTHENESIPRMPEASPFALGVITVFVYAVGFAMVAAWFALLLLEQQRPAGVQRAVSYCSVCGVVETVRELAPAPELQLRGTRDEGAVMLVAALGGASMPVARPMHIYETSVLHDDGSVRVLRDAGVPQWKRGDRVRVIKGRVEPARSAAANATQVAAADAADASPAGKIPSPAPPAMPVW